MIIETSFHDVADLAKPVFTEYLNQKTKRLKKLLTHFSSDSVTLRVHVEHFQHHDAFNVKLHLRSPLPGDCVSEEASHHLHKALDLAFDKLEPQVVRAIKRRQEKG